MSCPNIAGQCPRGTPQMGEAENLVHVPERQAGAGGGGTRD